MLRTNRLLSILVLVALIFGACQPIRPMPASVPTGVVHAVQPTGDAAKDVAAIQAAIDGAKDGDTILLKAGIFNFGDWKTNPIPGGHVMITKGVTVTGDGVDAAGNPKTIIQGGGYRMKNHWKTGEFGVITFGGDGKGGALDGVWLKEPHFYGVFISGFVGQNHENITVRNVKVTDISTDIPEWDQTTAMGRPIDMGGNVPTTKNGGPLGTVTIEQCNISNMGSTLDTAFLDPDTGKTYYADPDGKAFPAYEQQGTHAIGLWVSMSTNFIVRNNTLRSQHEGLVLEYMSGSGNILVADNDIVVETSGLPPKLLRGIRVTTTDKDGFPFPSTRTVRIVNNHIRVVGSGDPKAGEVGMLLSNDNGLPGFGATYVITGNQVEIQNGNAAFALGSSYPIAILKNAEISGNRISGTARYGVLSLDGAQNCKIADNDMSDLTPSIAHVGLYGANTYSNTVTGADGVYEQADGAHDNTVTGYTPK